MSKIGIGLFVLAVALIASINVSSAQQEEPVETIRPSDERLRGVVHPSKRVDLTPREGGIVMDIHIKEGDLVKEGVVLVQMDDAVADAQVKNSEANVRFAKATRDEAKLQYDEKVRLHKINAVSEFEMRTAELDLLRRDLSIEVSQTALARDEAVLDQYKIYSPFDGEVLSIDAEKGARLNQGDVALTFVSRDPLEARMNLPVELEKKLTVGQWYTFEAEKPINRQIKAKLKMVEKQIEFVSSTYRAVFTIENKDLTLSSGFRVRLLWPQPVEQARAE